MILALSWILVSSSVPSYYRGQFRGKRLICALAHGIVLASADTIDELDEVLRRPKFNRYLREEERLLFLAAFIRDANVVDVTEKLTECRDAKDNKFLELAVSGNATVHCER